MPTTNPDTCQQDTDSDGVIDLCDEDLDGDGIPNECDVDEYPMFADSGQVLEKC